MGYREIPDAEMAVGQPITSNLLAQIRDNIPAICAGEAVNDFPVDTDAFTTSGGGLTANTKVVLNSIPGDAKLATDVILNTTLAMRSVRFNNLKVAATTITAAAGNIATGAVTSGDHFYILGWQMWTETTGSAPEYQAGPGNGEAIGNLGVNWLTNTTPQMHFWVHERSSWPGATATVLWWYIAASPPYSLAGEPVPVFCFAIQRADGSLKAVMVSVDPPWNTIRATEYRDGKPWVKRRRQINRGDLATGRISKALDRAALLERIRNPEASDMEVFELTIGAKNREMNRYPHPFPSMEPGERAVLIAPVGDMAHELADLHDQHIAGQLLASGDIILGDEFTLPEQPEGVALLRASWR